MIEPGMTTAELYRPEMLFVVGMAYTKLLDFMSQGWNDD